MLTTTYCSTGQRRYQRSSIAWQIAPQGTIAKRRADCSFNTDKGTEHRDNARKTRSRYFGELERDLRYRIRERTRPAVVDVMGIKIQHRITRRNKQIRRLIYRGTYESTEMHIVRRHLSVGDRVLEISGLGAVGALCATIVR